MPHSFETLSLVLLLIQNSKCSYENEAVLVAPSQNVLRCETDLEEDYPTFEDNLGYTARPSFTNTKQQTYRNDVNTELLKMRLSKASFLVYFLTALAT